ncbi:MAG: hypothetical protein V8S99_01260 [Oscillospiraceae bacterium]
MDGKAAGAAAKVEHILPGRVGLQPPEVFLLVEEMAGLLPVFDADDIRASCSRMTSSSGTVP